MAFTNILVATDFSDAADAAVRCACSLAWTFGASLAIVHVVEDVESRALMGGGTVEDGEAWQANADAAARARLEPVAAAARQDRVEPQAVLLEGTPAAAIVGYATQHRTDLIVMGTHGRKGLGRLLFGSVAQSVIREAPCPVLTLRACHHEPPGARTHAAREELAPTRAR